jgi:hypothetical protein
MTRYSLRLRKKNKVSFLGCLTLSQVNHDFVEGEEYENVTKTRKNHVYHNIKKIHDVRKRNNCLFYLVQWEGYPQKHDWQWLPSKDIPKENIILQVFL